MTRKGQIKSWLKQKKKLRSLLIIGALALFSVAISLFFDHLLPRGFQLASLGNVTTPYEFPENRRVGVWLWDSPDELSSEEMKRTLDFLKEENINVVYIRIDKYTDILDSSDSREEKEERSQDFAESLQDFTRLASERGVEVEGLAGGTEWANPSHRYIPRSLTEFVIAYNESAAPEERLSGLQFDIEFYNQENFEKKNKENEITENYLKLVSELTGKASLHNLRIGFAVPFWMDGESDNVPPLFWDGKKKQPVYHVMDILSRSSDAYIAVMDYRDHAEGENGSAVHVLGELHYASRVVVNTEVLIGQLASKSKEIGVSFYGEGEQALKREIQELETLFGGYEALGGYSINHYESYKNLEDS